MENEIRDVIIIGSGPAGYTAGIYTGRAQMKPLMFSGDQFGGQLMYTTEVENFPGFKDGIIGPKLMMEMREQMMKFGAEVIDAKVNKVDFSHRPFRVYQGKNEYLAKSVIIATGAEALTLNLPKENDLMGKGVSVCAVCDAAFYREKTVYVVGGGDSAIEDARALTKFAKKVFMVVRRGELRASKIMQERALKSEKINMLWNTEVKGLIGDNLLNGLKLVDNKNGVEREVKADGIFFAIGHKPMSNFLGDLVKKDEKGYILTGLNGLVDSDIKNLWRKKYPSMTSVEGVFAAGDVVDFRYKQAITAAGMGTMAALDLEKWLESVSS